MIATHLPWSSSQIFLDTGGCCGPENRLVQEEPDFTLWQGHWNHYAFLKDGERTAIYQNGELWTEGFDKKELNPIATAMFGGGRRGGNELQGDITWGGLLDDIYYRGAMTKGGVRDSQVAAQDVDDPVEVALMQGQIQPQHVAQLGDLFLGHHEGELAGVVARQNQLHRKE